MAVPSEEERVPIGSILDGRYRIDAVLGSGGMGRVYRGEHTGIGRAVAIKVLHADLNRNREAAARFQREALASGRLDHPNIVGVSDFGVLDDGACYLVMEVLEGESLGDRLERDRRIPWRDALEIVRGVLAGLAHAHERGVVHRDIKPDNVFLARKGREAMVKILDFGIAKLYAGDADDPASTRAGLTVGTPAYLSPEQAVGGAITPASDIYSTSILLYEMLAGRAPFEDKDPLAMLGAHVSREPPAFGEVAPDLALPLGLEEMIQHGLAKTYSERMSTGEFIDTIDSILANAVGSARLAMPGRVIATPAPGTLRTPMPALATAAPSFSFTPVPGGQLGLTAALESITVPGTLLPPPSAQAMAPATRPVSLADAGRIPKRWLVIGAICVGVITLIIILAIAFRGGKSVPEAPPAPRPSASPPRAATVPRDDKTQLNALLYELERGKDCVQRRAAISRIVELGDPAALPALKAARYRMRGGVLGIGDENTNWCLTKEADAAIKKLTPPKK
ncbi:MAG: serine/threonine-protein kinase [Kofleriaceae bacterium]